MVAKKVKKIKVFLPSGGSVEVPAKAKESDIRDVCLELDPAVEGANLVANDDGSKTFVREMGTKGAKQRDLFKPTLILTKIKKLVTAKVAVGRKRRVKKLCTELVNSL